MACRIASYIARLTRVVLPGTFTFSITILSSLLSIIPRSLPDVLCPLAFAHRVRLLYLSDERVHAEAGDAFPD